MVRANDQKTHRNFEAMLNLALKAQSQSRSTIAALVDLKYRNSPLKAVVDGRIA